MIPVGAPQDTASRPPVSDSARFTPHTHRMISQRARPTTVSDIPDAAQPAPDGITLRRVQTLAEYQECLAIQEETWGASFRELVPPAILMVAQKLGGVCAGAFASHGRMLGFVFGITGIRDGRLAHWSDMLAVRTEARGTHIGERLKHYQRDLVRAVGVETMYWTFDPLVARNAYLNLARLGARAIEYVPNMYGITGSPLHGGLPTDRVVVAWDLTRDDGHAPTSVRPGVLVNPVALDGLPALNGLPRAPRVRIAVPRDLEGTPNEHLAAWRAVTREAFLSYLARGYSVVGFRRGEPGELPYYELSRVVTTE
jgi:predicted GNAT superfamily acetyltransferase